ncbi:SDR family NAD(P)-dependent oxidoreductase [Pseudoroseomonas cervicalis]|uniref:SDR family NAD(P)-dependent oxidoreductase n=1 Tax=Teichococcus cervicalis TaxID=204525 RepID=UPI002781B55F|nr:SDR family oxidoreductase [Pseudoroseomonas cervicalis]MDQ1081934.1 NAD(P)-dependent dehydrogenase (short-subunit alcohol dehydrogenase family) [Pseudoroseomonas cervicalis]
MTRNAIYPDLEGRSVFITGGGSGIGAALTEAFARQGSRVAFVDIAEEESRALVARLQGEGVAAPLFLPCDLRDIAALRAAIAQAQAAHGDITVLLNNAANDQRHKPEEVTPEYWDERMAINQRPLFFAAQAIVPQMQRAGGGSIVNFGSVSWKLRQGGMPAYTMAKASVHGLTRGLARDYGKQNIRVNTLVPGWVMTERQLKLWVTPEAEKEIEAGQVLAGRVLPAHIADMALFLASAASAMCSAQEFTVDGGWT